MGLKSLVAGVAIGAAATYVVIPNSPEHAVQPALTYLKENPHAAHSAYPDLVALTKQGFPTHPEQANDLLRSGLSSLELEPRTYLLMFERMRQKAEEKPELLLHFGPRALGYLKQQKPHEEALGVISTFLKALEGE
ncbi:hypothetical protein J4419_04885 [Candidatus Woesearchaeota archaeon]|nr:hypothetical protein [Candidatus Woesearchaeota archaeon]